MSSVGEDGHPASLLEVIGVNPTIARRSCKKMPPRISSGTRPCSWRLEVKRLWRVARRRPMGVEHLASERGCDIAVSDDGLQHYAMARDLEIAIIDAARRFGNGWQLPAGPLREPQSRLQTVDFVVEHGNSRATWSMRLAGATVQSFDGRQTLDPQPVHGVAGIGNPGTLLQSSGDAGLRRHASSVPRSPSV